MPGKVLIVDDIATNRIILQVKLATAGYTVLQATNAIEALQVAREAKPDLVLCTSRLQDMSSKDFQSAFENNAQLSKIARIIICSKEDIGQRLDLLNSGATDVLIKPPDIGALLARFRAILRNRISREDTLLQERVSRVIGFGEDLENFAPSTRTTLISDAHDTAESWVAALPTRSADKHCALCLDDVIQPLQSARAPDVIAIEITETNADKALAMLSDLRAASLTRMTKIIAILSCTKPSFLSEALDRGADDVLAYGYCADELALRLRRQAAAKHRDDKLRENMHEGLRAAATDALTGLYNRRFAMPHLARMTGNCLRDNKNCAVMVIDVDHFKSINDSFGHEAGDAALVALSGLLQKSLRNADLASRIGGEEFMIVLPDTSAQEAQKAAHRLCQMVAAHSFKLPGVPAPQQLTVSIGVAVSNAEIVASPHDDQNAEGLLRAADMALYGSKSHGRNQVTLSPRTAA